MLEANTLLSLRQRAEEVLKSKSRKNKKNPYNNSYELLNELNICKVEIELITEELKKTIFQFEELKEEYTHLYDFIPFGYFIFNKQGRIILVNEAGASLFGLKKNQLINKNLRNYVAPNFYHIFNENCLHILNSASFKSFDVNLLRRDGPIFPARFNCKAVQAKNGKKNFVTFIFDISEVKSNEEQLYYYQDKISHAEKYNYKSELASIIAHELNHPLSVISNYLYGSIRRLESKDFNTHEIIQALKTASKQSLRIAEIILKMKNFTCHDVLNFTPVDINQLIKNVIDLIKNEVSDTSIDIQYHSVKNLPAPMADKIHIEQVILNLARNAIEAMNDANIKFPKLTIELNQINTSKLEICIIDNGPGIPSEQIHQLFDPYFTTKPYGVGLGLAISRKIISAHKGELTLGKNPQGGTFFKFTLPLP